ncbi:ribonuclease P protein component [Antrihabitans sp. YC2-6]|uniref:ribonuclease P protein component n=1 Tax=Antrihabitans sp. YC2-6 TaxID=2799498 RepID=UPI0018F37238|nr:ribonuclease P protein component [Antrihabitans sp. YC2-6]MBJ8346442.1 ribonuclease P protein component [Antrihabitans sp. YC2-6]
MLPEPNRLHHHSDFSRTVRRGHRTGRRDVVVHAFDRSLDGPALAYGGPRVGLIVSKSVGSAVTRHLVARRLRHVFGPVVSFVRPEFDIVLRALPSSANASSAELERQVRSCVGKLQLDRAGSPESAGLR